MEKEPILSICIPTYNRLDCLEKSLEKMLPVCLENNVHIYISDNFSADDTENYVRQLTEVYSIIHYHRHQKNIGPDDNFEYVLKMPSTKYRWLMADSSYIDDIGSVLKDLELEDIDGYILNGGDGSRRFILPSQKRLYNNSISLMEEIGWHLTWISCMIYNERLINNMNFERYRDSSFNQTALMFEPTANRGCLIYFNPDVMVKNVPVIKESGWLFHVFDIMYKQWYLLIMSLPLYYPYEVKLKCIRDNSKCARMLSKYFHAKRRSEGKWNLGDVYRNKFFIQQSNGGFFFLIMLGICPPSILRCIIKPLSIVVSSLKRNSLTEGTLRKMYKWYVKITH